MDQKDRWRSLGESLRGQGLALSIPTMIAAAPIASAAIGYWIGKHWGKDQEGLIIGFVLGLAAAIRQTIRLLRMLSKESDEKGKSRDDEKS